MNATANRVRGLSTPAKIMLTVLVLAALTGFIVWIYYYRAYREHIMELSPYLIKGRANAMSEALSKRQFPLAYPKGSIANGFGFAYSAWIYIKDWQYNYGEPKYMFVKGDLASACPAIWLDARENTLCTSLALSAPGPGPGYGPTPLGPGGLPPNNYPPGYGPTPLGPGGLPPNHHNNGPFPATYKIQLHGKYLSQQSNTVHMQSSCNLSNCNFYFQLTPNNQKLNIYAGSDSSGKQLGIVQQGGILMANLYDPPNDNKRNVFFDFGYHVVQLDKITIQLIYADTHPYIFNDSSTGSNLTRSSTFMTLVAVHPYDSPTGLSGVPSGLSGPQQIRRTIGGTGYHMKQLRSKTPGIYDLQMVPADQCRAGDVSCQFIVSGSTIKNEQGMQMVLTNAYGGRLRAYMLAADLITFINTNTVGKPVGTSSDKYVLISDFTIQQGADSALTLQYTYNGAQWPFAVSNVPPEWPASGPNTTMNIDIGPSAVGVMTMSAASTVEGFDNGHLSMLSGFGPLAPFNYNQLSEGFESAASHKCNVENIPLQKWVHIAYVLDNRTTDIYVDGKLERSCVAPSVPLLNVEALSISPALGSSKPGFFGEYAKVQYFFNAIGPTDVARIYAAGPY